MGRWRSIWVLLLAPSVAMGSARSTAWSYGVDVGEQGESGTELWVGNTVDDLRHADASNAWNTWLGATTTLTDHLELAIYEIVAEPQATSLHLVRTEGQLRIKLADWVGILVAPVLTSGLKGGGLASLNLQTRQGALTLVGNVGASFDYDYGGSDAEIPISLGASYALTEAFRLSLEGIFRAIPAGDDGSGPAKNLIAQVGPGLAVQQGHFWLALNLAFGTQFGSPASSARLAMGLVF